jgi:hypothetical protein
MITNPSLHGLLADTWWYGLTQRFSTGIFENLARQRASEGFTAIQLVAGVPPEVGPGNINGWSETGPAWDLNGKINPAYLQHAKERIRLLNGHGLTGVVYGAWGHQMDWMGPAFMQRWWQALLEYLDDLDVIYCLTGEITLWIGDAERLLPDRSTDDPTARLLPTRNTGTLNYIREKYDWYLRRPWLKHQRLRQWEKVLNMLFQQTSHSILVHTNATEQSRQLLRNGRHLAANTTQTGHDPTTRNTLWQMPANWLARHPGDLFLNLEPWYEGILGQFHSDDQLYAYWASMLAGACGHCYGAQGIWNGGDGKFLAHWGKQKLEEAMQLDTPSLLGKSHAFFMLHWQPGLGELEHEYHNGALLWIRRRQDQRSITFIPDTQHFTPSAEGIFWLPLQGAMTSNSPAHGPLVIVNTSFKPFRMRSVSGA